jgi:hypothetical protein
VSVLVDDVAWADTSNRVHLVSANRMTHCGRSLEGVWVSRPRGLFFKQRVLQEDDEMCQACLDVSGGRGPINRSRR